MKQWIYPEEKGKRESLEKSLLLVSQAEIKILEVPQGLDGLVNKAEGELTVQIQIAQFAYKSSPHLIPISGNY